MEHIITRDKLSSLLTEANPPLLFEALPAKYFEEWHLPGARNMPHDAVAALAPQLAPDKNSPIVVYCANAACHNSHIAAMRLKHLGYRNVLVYAGGKKDWIEAGLAVERRSTVPA